MGTRLWRWLLAVRDACFAGCAGLGAAYLGVSYEHVRYRKRPLLHEPPRASPERLVRDQPPSPVERRLWSDLGSLPRQP